MPRLAFSRSFSRCSNRWYALPAPSQAIDDAQARVCRTPDAARQLCRRSSIAFPNFGGLKTCEVDRRCRMTLDGVAQASMQSNEDTSGGFRYGGWHMPYADEAFQKWAVRNLEEVRELIFGRRTYEAFAGHRPQASNEEQAMADLLNKTKYVASCTLSEPLEWQNSTLLHGDLKHSVAVFKVDDGRDLVDADGPSARWACSAGSDLRCGCRRRGRWLERRRCDTNTAETSRSRHRSVASVLRR